MKRVTLGFSILALSALFVMSCKKPKPNEVPEPDTEVQTSLDATWALLVMTDIETVCGFMGENQLLTHFYTDVPGTAVPPQGSITATRDTTGKYLVMSWFKTQCIDGRFREGSIFMHYGYDPIKNPLATKNSVYTREYGFVGRVTLSEYKVDGWKIENYEGGPAYLYNKLESNSYDPATTNLKWYLVGKFKFIHPTDATKDMIWDGKLFKTLTNTNNTKVFAANKKSAITWSLATVAYNGTVTGTTAGNVAYTMVLNEKNPLVRDFTCFPDKVAGVAITATPGVLSQRYQEFHPFTSGIASYTTGSAYPRQIYFGNEGEPQLTPQCDNTGEVLIKGISYKVNFLR